MLFFLCVVLIRYVGLASCKRESWGQVGIMAAIETRVLERSYSAIILNIMKVKMNEIFALLCQCALSKWNSCKNFQKT